MKKTTKIVALVLVATVLIIGVGYAAIQNITLNIAGTAKADASQANFAVKFSGEPTVAGAGTTIAAVTNDTNATMNVTGLTAKGESATATYTIQNTSADLTADLTATISNSNNEYFNVEYSFAENETRLKKGEATTVTVTVTLIKTPIEEQVSSTIGVQINVVPIQPEIVPE